MSRSITPELMHLPNRANVLAIIREQGPISRIDLATLLNLNPATITRITRILLDEGLVLEEGEGEKQGAGRKPVLLRFNPRARLLMAIYATERQITGVVADLVGNILTRSTMLITQTLSSGVLKNLIEELLHENPGYRHRLVAACLSAESLSTHHFSTDELLSMIDHTTLEVPIQAYRPAVLAALGEALNGHASFSLLYLGKHSTSCFYLNGQLYSGGLGLGRDGASLAAQICDAGLIAAFESELTKGGLSPLGQQRHTARMIFEAARRGDHAARCAVDSIAEYVAIAVLSIANILEVEMIVLAGSWTQGADVLIPAVDEQLNKLETDGVLRPQLHAARLGDEAPLIGAVQMARQIADGER